MSKLMQIEAGTRFGTWTVLTLVGRKGHSTFWKCVCDCGNFKDVNGYTLRNFTSNKCYECRIKILRSEPVRAKAVKAAQEKVDMRPKGLSAFNKVYSQYQCAAARRGREFSLNKDQFRALITQSCHYCANPPNKTSRAYSAQAGTFSHNGIDRKDNSLGYTVENSLPCCEDCNRAKLERSYEEFKSWIARVYNAFGDNK
jgi:hypothetical protein